MEGRIFMRNFMKTNNKSMENRSSFNSLIFRVNQMLKHIQIDDDLSCLLDEFLEKLKQYNIYLTNGIFNTNFTEAALLLQSSAELYCKKVDLLWDIIIDYQKRMVLYEKQNKNGAGEMEKLEERRRKYKRKRKIDTNQTQTTTKQIVSNYSFNPNEFCDYINQNYEQNDLLSIWNNYTDNNTSDNNNNEIVTNQTALFLPEDALRNLDDDEYIGRYDQFHIASIIPVLFHFNNENSIKIDTTTTVNLDENCNSDTFINFETSSVNNNSIIEEKLRLNSCFIRLEQLPNDLIDKSLRKSYSNDSGFNQSISSVDSRLFDESFVRIERLPQSIIDEKLKKFKRTKSSSCDSAFYDDINDTTSINNNKLCCGSTVIMPNNKNNIKKLKNCDDCSCGTPRKRRKISEKLLQKYSTGNTVLSKDFERFYFNQYKTAEGEEGVQMEFSDCEDDNDSDDDNDESTVFHDDSPDFIASNRLELSEIDDGFNSSSTSQFNEDIADLSQNSIREWKSFILPKLKNLTNQPEFNIREYGTKIIESSKIGETRLFNDIVDKKNCGEYARYFLTTLQLANTNNINFSGIIPGQLSNNTLKITIIDKTRYHEFLDDYQAPSEEVFRNQFERLQAIHPDIALHSTPTKLVNSPKKNSI